MDTPITTPDLPPSTTDNSELTTSTSFSSRFTLKRIVIGGFIFSVSSLLLANLLKRPAPAPAPVITAPTPIPTIVVTAKEETLATFPDEENFVQYVLSAEPIVYEDNYIQLLPEAEPDDLFFAPGKILPPLPDFTPALNVAEGTVLPGIVSHTNDHAYLSQDSKIQGFQITAGSEPRLTTTITPPGNSLITNNKIYVFSPKKITSYPNNLNANTNPDWTIELPPHVSPVSYRYYQGKILLITASGYDLDHPCSIHLLTARSARFNIPCSSIYHAKDPTFFDVLYSAIFIDPNNGSVSQPITFTGQRNKSLFYISENSLYFATTKFLDELDLYLNFFETDGRELLPENVYSELISAKNQLGSRKEKFARIQQPLISHLDSISESDRINWLADTRDKMRHYLTGHLQDLSTTKITKIDLSGLKILAESSLPGMPNSAGAYNQYQNNLRVIQTYLSPYIPQNSYSDLFILRPDLGPVSRLENIANGAKVNTEWFADGKIFFSASPDLTRIQTLDATNIYQPKAVTTLPISGTNFYLLRFLPNRVLVLYEKNGQATISLFNVQASDNPTEISSVEIGPWLDVADHPYSLSVIPDTKSITISNSSDTYLLSYSDSSLSISQKYPIPSQASFYQAPHIFLMGDAKIAIINPQNGQLVTEFVY